MKIYYQSMKVSTKNSKKEFHSWAEKMLDRYQKILLLQDHHLIFEYDENIKGGTLMTHANSYPYKTTYIRYGDKVMEYWDVRDKDYLRACLIHELCHSITDPLYINATERYITIETLANERERLTDHIANIIMSLKV